LVEKFQESQILLESPILLQGAAQAGIPHQPLFRSGRDSLLQPL
jgi:hypothetical protein